MVAWMELRASRLICDACACPIGVYERFSCLRRDGTIGETSMLALADDGVDPDEVCGVHLHCAFPQQELK